MYEVADEGAVSAVGKAADIALENANLADPIHDDLNNGANWHAWRVFAGLFIRMIVEDRLLGEHQ